MVHRIQNFEALATNDLRLDALSIAEAGFAAIDVGAALERLLRVEGGNVYIDNVLHTLAGRRLFFVGIGKCAFVAAETIEKLFGDALTDGIALDVSLHMRGSLTKIHAYSGTHPLPSEKNVIATRHIFELLSACTKDDLVIMLISGGGSALLCLPIAPMTCSDESALWNTLTERGASIQEINTVRKHISQARGGGLAAAAYPAEVISLIVSDVPGNDIEYIASGPTVLDNSTVADAEKILAHYAIPSSTAMRCTETPKEKKYFERVKNMLFLTNQDALSAMQKEAEARGYHALIVDHQLTGEAREIGNTIVKKLHDAEAKSVLLYAGESTVTLGSEYGAGGRNQEMVLAVLSDIHEDELILPFTSDGRDNTDHAGAIGDSVARAHALDKNVSMEEYLNAHRSYDFFKATGDALLTGYTGSNVSDLIIAMKQ